MAIGVLVACYQKLNLLTFLFAAGTYALALFLVGSYVILPFFPMYVRIASSSITTPGTNKER
jgi:hypothetical protein